MTEVRGRFARGASAKISDDECTAGTTGSGCADCGGGAGGAGLRAAPGEPHQETQRDGERFAAYGGKYLRTGEGTRDWSAPTFRRDHEYEGAGEAGTGFCEDGAAGYSG